MVHAGPLSLQICNLKPLELLSLALRKFDDIYTATPKSENLCDLKYHGSESFCRGQSYLCFLSVSEVLSGLKLRHVSQYSGCKVGAIELRSMSPSSEIKQEPSSKQNINGQKWQVHHPSPLILCHHFHGRCVLGVFSGMVISGP